PPPRRRPCQRIADTPESHSAPSNSLRFLLEIHCATGSRAVGKRAMIETPRSFAGTPGGQRTAEPDLLTEMLKAVRLNGAVFLSARLRAPFGVIDPRTYDQRTPMARLRRVSILHLIVSGECQFESAGETFNVSAGDLIFLGMPGEYSFRSDAYAKIVQANETVRPGPIEGVWMVDYGGDGAELRMVCGFVESSELLFAPLFRALPATLIERTSTDRVG